MANRNWNQYMRTLERLPVKLFGKVTTSTSGTIGSQECKGFSVAKTGSETGRYTVTLEDAYIDLLSASVIVEGADDAVYTADKGLIPILRNVDVAAKTLDIQFVSVTEVTDANTFPDAELADAASFYIELTLKNSTGY